MEVASCVVRPGKASKDAGCNRSCHACIEAMILQR
jgi:hypothetical protein